MRRLRPFLSSALSAAIACMIASAEAAEIHRGRTGEVEGTEKGQGIDTEHLFGFTEGSDIGEPGELELESQTTGLLGRRRGTFASVESDLQLKMPFTENFRLGPGIGVLFDRFRDVPGMRDRSSGSLDSVFLETRTRLLDRDNSPLGLTVQATPTLSTIDAVSNRRSGSIGADVRLLADREIVPGLVFGAVNVGYGQSAPVLARDGGSRSRSGYEVSGALSARVMPQMFVGGELRYAEAYDGLGLKRFAGEGLFLGPSVFVKLAPSTFLSATWSVQVAGRSAEEPGRLDLANFERHQVRVRFGVTF